MTAKSIRIAGRVIDDESGEGIEGLRVEAWDKDLIFDDLVGAAATDRSGCFEFTVRASHFAELFFDRSPDLYFKVFHRERLVCSTEDSVLWNATTRDMPVEIRVGHPALGAWIVTGRLLSSHGAPAPGVCIRVLSRRVGEERLLGEANTDADGDYQVNYTPLTGGAAHKAEVDLLVEAVDEDGRPLGRSRVVYGAGAREVIDLVVDARRRPGVAEFDRLTRVLAPLVNGKPAAALDAEEIAYLAGKTATDPVRVAQWVQAARLEQKTGRPACAFYALFRMGHPSSTGLLLAQHPGRLRAALARAVDANVVGSDLDVDGIADSLHGELVARLLAPANAGQATLGQLLDTTGLDGSQQRVFLEAALNHEGPVASLWAKLRAEPDLGENAVSELQLVLRLGALTLDHVPLVALLQRKRAAGEFASLSELSAYGPAQWRALLEESVDGEAVGAPAVVGAQNETARRELYAATLARIVEEMFPTETLCHRLQDDDFTGAGAVRTFLAGNEIELLDVRVDHYLAEHPHALDDLDDAPALRARLRAVQRVFRIVPTDSRVDLTRSLLRKGIHSAFAIRRLGRLGLRRLFNPSLARETLEQLYQNASQAAGTAQELYLAHSAAAGLIETHFGPPRPELVDGIPDWATLFGSEDLCTCEHCRSLYGPAAYLVDLLQYLERSTAAGHSALDELLLRRPDIAGLELSCQNTKTLVPYVDLVNEILENAVAGADTTYQSVGQSEDLRVLPEHFNPAAYEVLTGRAAGRSDPRGLYPWRLPFDLWATEARLYLQHFGVARDELMALGALCAAPGTPGALDVAAERLGLTPRDREVVNGDVDAHPWQLWGFADAAAWTAWLTGAPDVGGVAIALRPLLEHAGLDFAAVQALLQAPSVNVGGLWIRPHPGCVVDEMCVVVPTGVEAAPTLDRLHRFVRLQRRLDWSTRALDAALRVLPLPGDGAFLGDALLLRLAHLARLHRELAVPVMELLGWWSALDTFAFGEEPSRYDTLFLNKTVSNPTEEAFALNAARSELARTGESIASHRTAIEAVLGITAAELDALLGAELGPAGPEGHALSLANLSALHRVTSLARALGLSIDDFLGLRRLSPDDPFEAGDLDATHRFVQSLCLIEQTGLSVGELAYLLDHEESVPPSFGTEQAARLLDDLRRELAKTTRQFQVVSDPTGAELAAALGQLLDEAALQLALALVRVDAENGPADPAAFLEAHFAAFMSAADRSALLALATSEARAAFVQERVMPHLAMISSEGLVKSRVADALGLEMEAAEQLLTALAPARMPGVAADAPAMDDLLALGTPPSGDEWPEATPEQYPAQFAQLAYLHKLGRLIHTLGIAPADLAWVFDRGTDLGWLDLRALPVESGAAGVRERFRAWSTMAALTRLSKRLPGTEPPLIAVLRTAEDEPDAETFRRTLAERTRWSDDDVAFLCGPNGLGLGYPADFQSPETVSYLSFMQTFATLAARLGVPVERLIRWCSATVSPDTARAIRQAVKAKYDERQWRELAAPLQDELREQQRRALVDYLVHELALEDADELLERYLIDVQMSPCMITSRIKQAISSVQLFVQRCLMQLESEVTLEPELAEEWTWRKSYRLWEANRKVFLYPENWIDPALRSGKSPFFKELEDELRQGEITDLAVETAFRAYLEKLDSVDQLYATALYRDPDSATVHVFARAQSTPQRHYYRRWMADSYWTPWERVEIDIDAGNRPGESHLIPAVMGGRLFLLWPVFEHKTVEARPEGLDADAPVRAMRYFEVRLAWSEYRNGHWLPKQISETYLETERAEDPISPAQHRFWAFAVEGDLIVAGERYDEDGRRSEADHDGNHFCFSQDGQVFRVRYPNKAMEQIPGTRSQYMRMVRTEGTDPAPFELGYSSTDEAATGTTAVDRRGRRVSWTYGGPVMLLYESLLRRPRGWFSVLLPHQHRPLFGRAPFFFSDDAHTFFVVREERPVEGSSVHDRRALRKSMQDPDGVGLGTATWFRMRYVEEPPDDAGPGEFPPPQGGNWTVAASDRVAPPPPPTPLPMLGEARPEGNANVTVLYLTEASAGDELEAIRTVLSDRDPHDLVPETLAVRRAYRFAHFYHPYVKLMTEQLNAHGIDGLLRPSGAEPNEDLPRQQRVERYFHTYEPNPDAVFLSPCPVDDFDFEPDGAYALYNWELFFHAPLLIADELARNQRFAEAQRWYHYIFDPTDATPGESVPARFWKLKPLYEEAQGRSIRELLTELSEGSLRMTQQVERWRANPFDPHAVAALRPVAYQKAVVMKYLDNLIAWGDQLFRQETIEAINEATQLYVLAAQILGARPVDLPAPEGEPVSEGGTEVRTYADLADHWDELSNAAIDIETALPGTEDARHVGEPPTALVVGPTQFFCVPRNDKLLAYWDTVADRLFKIRHCMSIAGTVRELPLFQPPIEPGLLVRAAAAGVDISSALSDLNAPAVHYRFRSLLHQAVELCADVRSLGAALLSALEKRDAEGLSILRSEQEAEQLERMRRVKELQVEEAETAKLALEEAEVGIEARQAHFTALLEAGLNESENVQLGQLRSARDRRVIAQGLHLVAQVLAIIPEFDVGVSGVMGTPVTKARFGGSNLSKAIEAASQVFSFLASMDVDQAHRAGVQAAHDRRAQEWTFQAEQAGLEITRLHQQIEAARIRQMIAGSELHHHDRNTENAASIDAYLRDKYTNEELYSWMVSQLSGLYFQSYELAYAAAKRAERAFHREIPGSEASFVKFGYWDSLKKGLLSGEKLHLDLKRMENAYLEQNRREREITRHISLAELHPDALVTLRETGECYFDLPEAIFNLDHPGHYLRRIKSVSVTIPCVAGPYSAVSCTLTLQSSRVRMEATVAEGGTYAWTGDFEDGRFVYELGNGQSIATSGAQNDGGMFEMNFNDERYLPFEGAGVVSAWHLELPREFRQFDYDTISDVVLHLRYTARDGGNAFRAAVEGELRTSLLEMALDSGSSGLMRLFSARRDLPDEWHRFLHPAADESGQQMGIPLGQDRFAYLFHDRTLRITVLTLAFKLAGAPAGISLLVDLEPRGSATAAQALASGGSTLAGLAQASWHYEDGEEPGDWRLSVPQDSVDALPDALARTDEAGRRLLDAEVWEDLLILCRYTIE